VSTRSLPGHSVEERLEGPRRDHDPATEAHAVDLALPDELIRVAPGDAEYPTSLFDRECQSADRGFVGDRTTGRLARRLFG
jgi:hypothetical protein